MPLRDHFRPPLTTTHRWDAVHGLWPAKIVEQLFDALPAGFRAEPKVHLGSPVEIDVSTYDTSPAGRPAARGPGARKPGPEPTFAVIADLADDDAYEVRIYDTKLARRLVAAVEIVSPANKQSPAQRGRFLAKVSGLLKRGVAVVIVDPVTTRRTNFYAALLARYGQSDPRLADPPPRTYAVALRARRPAERPAVLEAWYYPAALGQPLPTVPLWLSKDLHVPLPLDPGYEAACRLLHIE